MAVPPIRFLRIGALEIDADTPCVLQVFIPISLPHRLDPSLPAPPYHPNTMAAERFRDLHAMPVLRRLMAQVVSQLFGPDHAAAALDAPTRATSPPSNLRLLATWDACTVVDKEHGFDFEDGYWKDILGEEGRGPIEAYHEDLWGRMVIYHAFKLSLTRRVQDAKQLVELNPRALRFDLVGGDARRGPGARACV